MPTTTATTHFPAQRGASPARRAMDLFDHLDAASALANLIRGFAVDGVTTDLAVIARTLPEPTTVAAAMRHVSGSTAAAQVSHYTAQLHAHLDAAARAS